MSPTLLSWLEKAETATGTGLRLLDRRERATFHPWSEIVAAARETAGALQVAGVAPGNRVALVFPTGLDFFHAFFGTLLAGGVPAPLYPPLRLSPGDEYAERTRAMIAAAGARLVLATPRIRARCLGGAFEPSTGGSADVRCLEDLPPGRLEAVEVRPRDLALVQFSSGTTSRPKPAALSHRSLVAQVEALNALWPDTEEVAHSGVSWLPLYHDMGLVGCVLTALERPGVLTLMPPELFAARPAAWLRAISRFGGTLSAAPDFAFSQVVERVRDEELEGLDLSSWRVALNGAEPISAANLRAFEARLAPLGLRPEALTPVYGLSEAALAVTFSAVDRPWRSRIFERETLTREGVATPALEGREIVSLGPPLAGFEVEIRGDSGRRLEARRVGRVWARGPSLMEGYLELPSETNAVLQGGWLDTGDVGFLDAGELFLTGRFKDVLIVRGNNHDPRELELAVEAIEGVLRGGVAALSALGEGGTEQLLLLVESRREAPEERAEVAKEARGRVLRALGLELDRVAVLPPGALPRTSSGKLRRTEARQRFERGEWREREA